MIPGHNGINNIGVQAALRNTYFKNYKDVNAYGSTGNNATMDDIQTRNKESLINKSVDNI